MKNMALVEEELKARDMLIEQLTIKLTASENACTTLIDEYSKLQAKRPPTGICLLQVLGQVMSLSSVVARDK